MLLCIILHKNINYKQINGFFNFNLSRFYYYCQSELFYFKVLIISKKDYIIKNYFI